MFLKAIRLNSTVSQSLFIFDKLIKETPHFYKPYFGRGIIFEDQKNYTGALSDFKKVIEIKNS